MSKISTSGNTTTLSAKYFQALVENLTDIILVVNADAIIGYASPSFEKLVGFSEEETIGKSVLSFVHPEDLSRTKTEYAQLKNNPGLIQQAELRLIHKDGSVRCVNGKRKNLLMDTEIEGIILNAQDVTERFNAEVISKEKEEKLRESEIKYRELVEGFPDAIAIYIDGKIVFANRASVLLIKAKSVDELIGLPVIELVHPAFREFVAKRMMEAMKQGKVLPLVEEKFLRFDGSEIDVEVKAIPIRYDKKNAVQIIVRDITKRKQTEEALQQNENVLRLFVENSPAAIAMFDKEMRYLVASRRFLVDYDLDDQLIIGRSHYEIFPEISERWKEIHRRCLAGATEKCEEDPFPRASGKIDWIKWEIIPWNKSPNEIGGIIIFSEVITKRKRAEEEIRIVNEKLRLAQTASKAGMWDWNIEDNTFYWSEEFLELFGMEKGTTPGFEVWTKCLHPHDIEIASKKIEEAVENKTELLSDYRIILPGNEIRWIRSTGRVFYDSDKPIRMTGLCFDYTERKLAEQELQQAKNYSDNLIHTANVMIVGLDADGHISLFNNTAEKISGYTKAELTGKNWLEVLVPKDRYLSAWTEFDRLTQGDNFSKTFENPILTKLGEERIISWQNSIFYTEGKITGTISFGIDITDNKLAELELKNSEEKLKKLVETGELLNQELAAKNIDLKKARTATLNIIEDLSLEIEERKTAEEKLRENENKMRVIIEGTPYLFFYMHDLNGKVTYISPSIEKITGHSVDEWLNQTHWFVTDNELNNRTREITRAHIQGEFTDVSMLLEIEHAEKRPILLELYENPIIVNGIVVGVQGVAHDITERKQAEAKIRESEKEYRELFELANDSIIIFEPENETILEVNPMACQTYGFSKEEFIGMSLKSISENTEKGRQKINEIMEGIPTNNFETVYFRKDGAPLNILVSASVIEYKGQKAIQSINLDISERIDAENKLRQSELLYKMLANNSSDVIWTMDFTGKFTYISPSVEKLRGFTVEEVMKQPFEKVISPGSQKIVREKIQQRFTAAFGGIQLKPDLTEVEQPRKDGSSVWTEVLSDFLFDESGEILGIIGVSRDITERKRVERELIEKEEKFRMLTETASDAIVSIDSKGNVISWNGSAEKIFGFTSKQIVGKNVQLIIPTGHKKAHQTGLKEIVSGRKPRMEGKTITIEGVRKDGTVFPIELSLSSWKSADTVFFTAIMRDITERIKAEQELAVYRNHLEELVLSRTGELDKVNESLKLEIEREKQIELMLKGSLEKEKEINNLKNRFISTVSHEFRTPLASIQLSSGLLQRYAVKWPQERLNEHFHRINKSITNLTNLLDGVLTINRADSNKIQFTPKNIDLKNLCETVIEESAPYQLPEHKLNFTFKAKKTIFYLDPNLMQYVLSNLLINAFKYSPNGGEVSLKVALHRNKLRIIVKDCGIGISPEDLPFLFEPFYRGANVGDVPGSGLGLSIVQKTIEMQNGKIEVSSIEETGTIFTIEFPIKKEK